MENDLAVVEQKGVKFYDDELVAIRASDGQVYVSIRQMCDALGIDPQGQTRRMERHTILSEGLKGVDKLSTPGGPQSAYVLRVDLVPLWLSGIRTVKAVAIALGRQTKRNEFGAVYGELYRKFGITSYKQLPAGRFQAAMEWITEWHQNLVGDTPF